MLAKRFALAAAVCGLSISAASATDYRAPTFSSAGVVNAATGQTLFAPYSICSLYGTNLFFDGSAAANNSSSVPNSLAGVTVLIGPVPAGVLFLSGTQINFLIPNSLTPGTYSIRVVRSGLSSQAVPIVVQEVAPGLFATSPGLAAAQHADGTPINANSPASPGEVIVVYGTGFGRTKPDPSGLSIPQEAALIAHFADLEVLLDGTAVDPAMVQYAGVTPFNAGLYQINVRLPDNLPATNPELRVSIAGSMSPPGLLLVTGPGDPSSSTPSN